jgi:hypothetical protein
MMPIESGSMLTSAAHSTASTEEKLRELGFRSEALRVEMTEWRKLRDEYDKRHR